MENKYHVESFKSVSDFIATFVTYVFSQDI